MTHRLVLCDFLLEVALLLAGTFRPSPVWLQTDATRPVIFAGGGTWTPGARWAGSLVPPEGLPTSRPTSMPQWTAFPEQAQQDVFPPDPAS